MAKETYVGLARWILCRPPYVHSHTDLQHPFSQQRLRIANSRTDALHKQSPSVYIAPRVSATQRTTPIFQMQTTTTNPSLVLSYDDVTSTCLDCEELGLHYQVSAQSNFLGNVKTTQIRRRDIQSGKTTLIAQWERHSLQPDLFRFTGAGTSNQRVTSLMSQRSGYAPW